MLMLDIPRSPERFEYKNEISIGSWNEIHHFYSIESLHKVSSHQSN